LIAELGCDFENVWGFQCDAIDDSKKVHDGEKAQFILLTYDRGSNAGVELEGQERRVLQLSPAVAFSSEQSLARGMKHDTGMARFETHKGLGFHNTFSTIEAHLLCAALRAPFYPTLSPGLIRSNE
jgi:hypothetical protein